MVHRSFRSFAARKHLKVKPRSKAVIKAWGELAVHVAELLIQIIF